MLESGRMGGGERGGETFLSSFLFSFLLQQKKYSHLFLSLWILVFSIYLGGTGKILVIGDGSIRLQSLVWKTSHYYSNSFLGGEGQINLLWIRGGLLFSFFIVTGSGWGRCHFCVIESSSGSVCFVCPFTGRGRMGRAISREGAWDMHGHIGSLDCL